MAGVDAAGGSRELARLLDEAGEELLFDFRHYLGLDLLDVFRDESGLTPRLALIYASQLPPESATIAKLRGGPEFRGWGKDRYMMADAIDLLQNMLWAFISANTGKKRRKPPHPERYERPDLKKRLRNRPNSFRAQAAARLAAIKKRKATNGGTGREA